MSAQDDGLIKRYREANEHDAARPGAHVRGAVRAHAQMLAAAAVAADNSPATDPVRTTSRTAANSSRWKISALATVALVSVTGLLMLQFERGTQEEQEIAYGQHRAEAPAAAPPHTALPAPAAAVVAAPAATPGAQTLPATAKTAETAKPSTAKVLANTATSTPQAESASVPSLGGARSGFAGSPPTHTDRAEVPPTAPHQAPVAERRQRSAENDGLAAKAVGAVDPSPAPAAPAAHSVSGSHAARDSLSTPAASADHVSTPTALESALLDAARAGRILQVESLVSQGAPVNARDSAGKTALMLAATNGHTSAVQKLLALGATPGLADREGLNAAQQARRQGYTHIADLIDAAP